MMFDKEYILKDFTKSTGKHLCWSSHEITCNGKKDAHNEFPVKLLIVMFTFGKIIYVFISRFTRIAIFNILVLFHKLKILETVNGLQSSKYIFSEILNISQRAAA